MDQKVKDLMYATGVDEKLATMLVEFTGGDVEGGKKIIRSMPKDYVALKIRYMGYKTHKYGLILIILNVRAKEIEDIYVTVDNNIEASQMETSLKFEDFREAIVHYINSKNIDLELMGRIRETINKEDFREKIFLKLLNDNHFNIGQLKLDFSEMFFKIITEPNCAVKIEEEEIDLFRLYKSKKSYFSEGEGAPGAETEGAAGEKAEGGADKKEEVHIRNISLVLLKIEPVLSPIKGTPVNELQTGDQIMVKIIDEREIGNYLGDLLGGRVNNSIVPIPATIMEMQWQEETENVMIMVQFGPGIAGRMFVPPEIKIETPITEELVKLEGKDFFKMGPVWIIVLLILFFIFIYLTIYFGK